jgi:hypothetical protein
MHRRTDPLNDAKDVIPAHPEDSTPGRRTAMHGHMVLSIPEVARAQIEERRREADRYHVGRLALRLFKRSAAGHHLAAGGLPLSEGSISATPALGVG